MSQSTVPSGVNEMFADAQTPAELATRLESYKAALDDSARQQMARKQAGYHYAPKEGWVVPESAQADQALDTISKSVSPEVLASVRAEIDRQKGVNADLGKDLSLTSPLSTGFVPYDLEAPAKLLFPVLTPLRNRIPRVKGQGTARRYKRLTGISGSGTAGVARLSPFINDTSTISVGSLTLRRGPKISYAADEKTINYKQMGVSDVVPWSAQFAGQGFMDARQLSHSAVLYASMLADEYAILGARGTDSGFAGALATPTVGNITLTARTAGVGETGNSAFVPTVFVRVAAEGIFGESIATAEVTTTGLSAATGKVVDITMTGAAVNGATGFRVYVGSVTGIANQFYVGRTGVWGGTSGLGTAAFTINFTGAGTGGTINAGANGTASDTSASADMYDGLLTTALDNTQSGGIYAVNGKLSVSTPGAEFQNLFAGLYTGGVSGVASNSSTTGGGMGVKADPNLIWMHGLDRKQLSNTVITGGTNVPAMYFTQSVNQNGLTAGAMVSGIVNEVTGRALDIMVHPYFPQGVALAVSESLPIPDSEVPSPFYYALPQDYMAMDWPIIQHTFDIGSYWFGAFINPAPMFHGAVTGIQAA